VSASLSLAGGISSPKSPVGTVQKIGLHGASLIRIPGAALGVPRSSLAGETGGRVERGSATAFFISLRGELAGDPAQNFTKRRPRFSFDWLSHGHNHEGIHAREVVKVCRRLGNVCRA